MNYFFRKIIWCFVIAAALIPAAAFAQTKVPKTNAPDNAPPSGYRIRQGDKLSVKFFHHPELNEPTLMVRPDGFITLQLIDEVKAENLTIGELKTKLEQAYDETLLNPVISVALIEFVAPRVFVGGQVGKPGSYALRDGQTLVQVLFLAGGFTRDANRKAVLHARPKTNGEWDFQAVNVMKIVQPKEQKKDSPPDLQLRDGDYVFVADSKISQFNRMVESFRGWLPNLLF